MVVGEPDKVNGDSPLLMVRMVDYGDDTNITIAIRIIILCRTLRLSKNVPGCETMASQGQGGSKPFLSFHWFIR